MLSLALSLAAAAAGEPPADPTVVATNYPGERLPDAELDRLRGGFRLPNGLDVNIAVASETSLDGQLLLRSVYRIDTGAPTLQLYAPRPGESVATERPAAGGGGQGGLAVQFDRSNGVLFVPGGAARPPVTITNNAQGQMNAGSDGLAPIAIAPGGSVPVAGGTLSLGGPNGTVARLDGAEIDVAHIFGQGYGTLIANTGNDRVIDTVTSISIDLSGATPENLGSSLMRVENLALDAVRLGVR